MKRILIVDDDEAVLARTVELVRSLVEELNKGSFEILTATSGGEAFGILSYAHIDLLITDYSMPDVSGLELVGLLHDRPEMKKVLLTFSRIEMKDRVKIAEAGIDEIITKPVDETRLKRILDRFL